MTDFKHNKLMFFLFFLNLISVMYVSHTLCSENSIIKDEKQKKFEEQIEERKKIYEKYKNKYGEDDTVKNLLLNSHAPTRSSKADELGPGPFSPEEELYDEFIKGIEPLAYTLTNDPDEDVRDSAAEALEGIITDFSYKKDTKVRISPVIPALKEALKDNHGFVRERALRCLAILGETKNIYSVLKSWLFSDPSSGVRRNAIRYIRDEITKEDAMAALQDSDEGVRFEVAKVLIEKFNEDKEALPVLLNIIRESKSSYVSDSLQMLASLGNEGYNITKEIAENHPNGNIRALAKIYLIEVDLDKVRGNQELEYKILQKVLFSDSEQKVRDWVLDALGRRMNDKEYDEKIRWDIRNDIYKCLEDKNDYIRISSVFILTKDPRAKNKTLRIALDIAKKSTDYMTIDRALSVFRMIKNEEAVNAIKDMSINSKDERIRRRAKVILQEIETEKNQKNDE